MLNLLNNYSRPFVATVDNVSVLKTEWCDAALDAQRELLDHSRIAEAEMM